MKSSNLILSIFFTIMFSAQVYAQKTAPVDGSSSLEMNMMSAPEPEAEQVATPGAQNKPKTSATDGLSHRDPFKLPEYIIIRVRQKAAASFAPTAPVEDLSVEPIKRWPLGTYQLVGIIWDVKKPKAMFSDRFNSIHVLQINDFIGSAHGVITRIQSGSVTVLEGKIPQIIKLKK